MIAAANSGKGEIPFHGVQRGEGRSVVSFASSPLSSTIKLKIDKDVLDALERTRGSRSLDDYVEEILWDSVRPRERLNKEV